MSLPLLSLLLLCVMIGLGQSQSFTFIVLGDWGDTLLPGQQRVADRMAEWSVVNETNFIMTVGDNIYPNGILSVDDPQMDNKWRYVYNHTSLEDLLWYASLGNHDYGRDGSLNEWNQVEFDTVEPRWIMPHLWYSFQMHAGGAAVDFFMLDTTAFKNDENNPTEMLDWLDQGLAQSTAVWKVVAGHHTIYSVGEKGPVSSSMYNTIRPILEKHNVDVYLCGHDHNMQHFQNTYDVDVDYIISGAGGALQYLYRAEYEDILLNDYNVTTKFFERDWGFAGFTFTPFRMDFEFVNQDGFTIYNYTRYRN